MFKARINNILNTILLLLLAILITEACHPGNLLTRPERVMQQDTVPTILFLNYLFKQDTLDSRKSVQVNLLSHSTAQGKLKPALAVPPGEDARFWVCLRDAKGQILQRIPLDNPLVQNLEYLGEDNQFARKTIQMAQWPATVRLQFLPGTRRITLETGTSAEKASILNTFKIE